MTQGNPFTAILEGSYKKTERFRTSFGSGISSK